MARLDRVTIEDLCRRAEDQGVASERTAPSTTPSSPWRTRPVPGFRSKLGVQRVGARLQLLGFVEAAQLAQDLGEIADRRCQLRIIRAVGVSPRSPGRGAVGARP